PGCGRTAPPSPSPIPRNGAAPPGGAGRSPERLARISAAPPERPPAPPCRPGGRCRRGRRRLLRRPPLRPQLAPPLRGVLRLPGRGEHRLEGVAAPVLVHAVGEVRGVLAGRLRAGEGGEGLVALLVLLAQQHDHGQQGLAVDVTAGDALVDPP